MGKGKLSLMQGGDFLPGAAQRAHQVPQVGQRRVLRQAPHEDVVIDGKLRHQAMMLRTPGGLSAEPATQFAKQRRLAGTALAEQRDTLTLVEGKGEARQDDMRAVPQILGVEANQRAALLSLHQRSRPSSSATSSMGA